MPPAQLRSQPTKPIPAGRLPKLRQRLVQMWEADTTAGRMFSSGNGPYALPFADLWPHMHEAITSVGESRIMAGPVGEVSPEAGQRYCRRQGHSLTAADLYWISEEFTELAITSGRKLPDLTLTREDLPAPHGLLMFAKPFHHVVMRGLHCPVTAASWALLPGGVWVTMYGRVDQIEGMSAADRDELRSVVGMLWPISTGAGAPFSTTVNFHDEGARSSWGPLIAAWLLIQQPNLAQVTEEPAERDFTRTYARAHGGGSPAPVRVVDIRHHEPRERGSGGSDEPGRRRLTVRSIVGEATGGFWRDQAYGPNWSLRRRQFILPFERGPKDAPLRTTGVELVRRLR